MRCATRMAIATQMRIAPDARMTLMPPACAMRATTYATDDDAFMRRMWRGSAIVQEAAPMRLRYYIFAWPLTMMPPPAAVKMRYCALA